MRDIHIMPWKFLLGLIAGIIVGFLLQVFVLHTGTNHSVFKKYIIVSEDKKQVSVEITDKYYKEGNSTFMYFAYSHMYIPVKTDPEYSITCKYNDKEYEITGKETYEKFKDKIGETATGELKIVTYGDGKVRQQIISIK